MNALDGRAKVLFAAWALTGVLWGGTGPDARGAERLRLGTLVPQGSSYYNHLKRMDQEWRKAPDGGASLVIYPDGRMGGEAEMVRRMRNGQLQAGMLTAVGLAEIEPAVSGLQSLPMMFRSLEEVDYVGGKLQPKLERLLEEKGFTVLFWADAGWVRFFSTQPVLSPDDMKKLKLWTWAGSPDQVDLYKKAGFKPVPLETKDIVLSLQTGSVNAIPTPSFPAMASQLDALAPHMLELNWAPLVGAAVVVKSAWDKLSPADRKFMRQAAAKAGRLIQQQGRKEADEAVEAMQKRGLTVHQVPAEVEATWRKAVEVFYPEIRGRIVPEDIFDEVARLLKEYRTTQAAAP